ncbi:MAG: hypothetical protein PHX18_03875 [Candidatus Gastranaerophilales bacterium]|nr:hypothetical protein [Candidatus Gastranaerophilales bacterium]
MDIDVELLTQYAHLLTSQQAGRTSKSGKSKKSGAAKFYEKSNYNSSQLVKDLNLNDPKVRYQLIKMMKSSDVSYLLKLLQKKHLLLGMKFFTKEKLAKILGSIPQEEMIKVLKNMYTNKQIMEMLPEATLKRFLASDKIEKKNVMEYLKQLNPQELNKMYEEATGQRMNTSNKSDMLKQIEALKPEKFLEAIQSLPKKHLVGLSAHLLKEQPELFKEIPTDRLSECFEKSLKGDMIQGMAALDKELLVNIAQGLPPQLIQQVVTMIDPKDLANVLLENCTDLLGKLG